MTTPQRTPILVPTEFDKTIGALAGDVGGAGAQGFAKSTRAFGAGGDSETVWQAVPTGPDTSGDNPEDLPAGRSSPPRAPASCNFIDAFLGLITFSIGSVRPEGATCMN